MFKVGFVPCGDKTTVSQVFSGTPKKNLSLHILLKKSMNCYRYSKVHSNFATIKLLLELAQYFIVFNVTAWLYQHIVPGPLNICITFIEITNSQNSPFTCSIRNNDGGCCWRGGCLGRLFCVQGSTLTLARFGCIGALIHIALKIILETKKIIKIRQLLPKLQEG